MRLAWVVGMFHLVARTPPGRLLFRTHVEAAALFVRAAATFPDNESICLMPDHLHLVVQQENHGRLRALMSRYARWRNTWRGEAGTVWQRHPAPQPIPDAKHLRRTVRYVHLNPCRAGIVDDPLAWPWSTHRDAVGLAARPVRAVEREAERFHRWVSADPTVRVDGTPLHLSSFGGVRWEEVAIAVSAVCRVPRSELRKRGEARSLAVRTAFAHDFHDVGEISEQVELSRSAIYALAKQVPPILHLRREPALLACYRAVGDPRLGELHGNDLRREAGWGRVRSWR